MTGCPYGRPTRLAGGESHPTVSGEWYPAIRDPLGIAYTMAIHDPPSIVMLEALGMGLLRKDDGHKPLSLEGATVT